jgi:hypothetical protein
MVDTARGIIQSNSDGNSHVYLCNSRYIVLSYRYRIRREASSTGESLYWARREENRVRRGGHGMGRGAYRGGGIQGKKTEEHRKEDTGEKRNMGV